MKFFYLFKKDIEFLNNLSDRNKKLLIYFLISVFFIIIFFIEKEVFFSFLKLLFYLLIWKIILELLLFILIDNNNLKTFIRNNDDKFVYILKILLFIQKWKNPLLILLLYIDKILFKIIRNLIYMFKVKYNYELTDSQLSKVFFFFYFIINLILGPLKLILGVIYTLMYKIVEISFSFFFIIRIMSFIFSVLMLSSIFKILYNFLGLFYLLIFIYLFLVFINCIVKYLNRDFEYLKIRYINKFINTDYLINLRNHCTFIGILIINISWYNTYLIEKKYIDVMSSHSKLELEEGFYKYWEYYKRFTWFNTVNLWKEIKNRPSFFFYINMIIWMKICPLNVKHAPTAITNIMYLKLKISYLNIPISIEMKQDLDFLYKFFSLRLKLLLFMLWDIDSYINNKQINQVICEYDKRLQIFNITINSFSFLDWDNFKVEENEKDLPFYDVENNMEFFNELYILIGIVPFNENPLELTIVSDEIIEIKDIIERVDLNWDSLGRSLNLIAYNRGWYYSISNNEEQELLLIEKKVENWIIEFLKKTREEWLILIEKETIENRNIRLLKEIEDYLKKKL